MADARSGVQFSVFLVNKPGVLAQVTRALADEKINIVAMTLVDSQEHGVLRLVAENPQATRSVLGRLNLPMTETEVLCVDLPNQTGALADVASVLGQAHININYAYCTSGVPGGERPECSRLEITPRRSGFCRKGRRCTGRRTCIGGAGDGDPTCGTRGAAHRR